MEKNVKAMIMVEEANLAKWNCGYAFCVEVTKTARTFNKKIFLWNGPVDELALEIQSIKKANFKRLFLITDKLILPDLKPVLVSEFCFPLSLKDEGRKIIINCVSKFADKTWAWVHNAVDCGMVVVNFTPETEQQKCQELQKNLADLKIKAEVRKAYVFFSGK